MKEHRQVSDICADSAPAAALSNDPNSVVPGRDYRTPQLSEARHEEGMVERGGGVEGLGSDKVERGTDSDMEGRLRVTERGGVGGRRLTQFLSLSQRTGMLGWMTNPKNPNGCSRHTHMHMHRGTHTHTHTQFIQTLQTGAHFIILTHHQSISSISNNFTSPFPLSRICVCIVPQFICLHPFPVHQSGSN